MPELLGDGRRGRLVAPNDLAALTRGLRSLMSADRGDGETVGAAFQAVSGQYTSARMTQQYLDAYEAIREPAC
jgi:glycosyltransferase involved in cell wall biosynthesis